MFKKGMCFIMTVNLLYNLTRILHFMIVLNTIYHWIRDRLDSMFLKLEKIHTDANSSDMMTKSVPKGKFGIVA